MNLSNENYPISSIDGLVQDCSNSTCDSNGVTAVLH